MNTAHEHGQFRLAATRALAAVYELWMVLPLWLLAHHIEYVHVAAAGKWLALAALASALSGAASVWIRTVWKQALVSLLSAGLVGAIVSAMSDLSFFGAIPLFLAMLLGFTVGYRYGWAGWYWTGVGVFFAISSLFNIVPGWNDYSSLLMFGGVVCLAAALFASNVIHLRKVTYSSDNPRRVPVEIKRHNRFFVAGLLIGALLLAAGLGSLIVYAIKHTVVALIRWIYDLLSRRPKGMPMPEPEETPAPTPVIGEGEPLPDWSWLINLLEKITLVVGVTILALLLLWGAYYIFRNRNGFWKKWFKWLSALLRRSEKAASASGFTDEESSLFSWEEAKGRLRRSLLGRMLGRKEPSYENLPDNRERARFLYRKWLRDRIGEGYGAKRHLTPEETLADAQVWRASKDKRKKAEPDSNAERQLVDVYYRARYSQEEPSDEELALARSKRSGA
ncbi:hypothetical protein ACFPVX_17045 [Cohnella faecalis]|uniref:DUF4129 domain-containing protein n=1 Tax=Cohnella faecalis TaxID=2315694 RepID=A0A398CS29_9BACL|nr:hypothetical protein [Cohnella faecalis]RIE04029.1 hypothetical protein D3H35_08735 [Cohnella faecalis]